MSEIDLTAAVRKLTSAAKRITHEVVGCRTASLREIAKSVGIYVAVVGQHIWQISVDIQRIVDRLVIDRLL